MSTTTVLAVAIPDHVMIRIFRNVVITTVVMSGSALRDSEEGGELPELPELTVITLPSDKSSYGSASPVCVDPRFCRGNYDGYYIYRASLHLCRAR
jgi:hypothetical protein